MAIENWALPNFKKAHFTPKKEKKIYEGSETTLYINLGKGDTLAQRAMGLLHQGKRMK